MDPHGPHHIMEEEQKVKNRKWYDILGHLEAYAGLTHDRPILTLFCGIGLILAIVVSGFFLGPFSLGANSTGKEWIIMGSEQVSHMDAMEAASKLLEKQNEVAEIPVRSVKSGNCSIILIFESASGNMYTPKNLQSMSDVENMALGYKDFKDYCYLVSYPGSADKVCAKATSPINLIVPNTAYPTTYTNASLDGLTQATIDAQLQTFASDSFKYGFFVDKNFSATNLKSQYSRSMIPIGVPLPDFTKAGDDSKKLKEQEKKILEGYLQPVEKEFINWSGIKAPFMRSIYLGVAKAPNNGDVRFWWFNRALMSAEFTNLSQTDFLWAVFSVAGVFAYMYVHTTSLLIAGMGMFMNFMSFMLGWCIYRFICQIKFFDTINLLLMFIVLGIGADDVFVFTDAFKQSLVEEDHCATLRQRIMYTSRRSSKAIFITSFTTMAAFLATATSQIMPIASFGIFAALTIIMLYTQNVLLMPATLTLYCKYFEHLPPCVPHEKLLPAKYRERANARREEALAIASKTADAARSRANTPHPSSPNLVAMGTSKGGDSPSKSSETADPERGEASGSSSVGSGTSQEFAVTDADLAKPLNKSAPWEDDTPEEVAQVKELRWVERMFHGWWMRNVYRFRYVLLIFFLAMMGVGAYYTAQLRPPTQEEEWFPKDHLLQQAMTLIGNNGPFTASSEDSTADMMMVWGLKGMDTSGVDRWQVEDRGKLEWDDDFDPSTTAAQTYLLDVCNKVRAVDCDIEGACMEGKMIKPTSTRKCVFEALNDFLAKQYPNDATKRLGQLDKASFDKAITDFTDVKLNPTINTPKVGFPAALGWFKQDDGSYKLKYVFQTLESTYRPPKPAPQTKQFIDLTNSTIEKLNAGAPKTANQAFMTAGVSFMWYDTQMALLSGAIQGVSLVFALGFAVLVLVTLNFFVSLFTIFTIAGIVVTVMGIYTKLILGWSLGIAESVAIVILIGFSMDYCLHIAAAYVESERATRFTMARQAVTHMGISVFAGAITTLISSIFLFGATMTFFTKFAFLITFTIITAFSWTMFFFVALLSVVGPERTQGSVLACLAWMGAKMGRRTKREEASKDHF